MASPLFNMLADLSRDPEKLESFQLDPKEFARQNYGVDFTEIGTNEEFMEAVENELKAQFGDPGADIIFC